MRIKMEVKRQGRDLENKKEIDIILTHLERVPDLVSGTIGGYFKRTKELSEYWTKIASEINERSFGNPRSGKSVKKKWHDLKHRLKLKVDYHVKQMKATDGNIFPLPSYGEEEDRILRMVGTTFVDAITKGDLGTAAGKLKHCHNPVVTSTFTISNSGLALIGCQDPQVPIDGNLNTVAIAQGNENDMVNLGYSDPDMAVLPASIETAGSQVESVDNSRESLQNATTTSRPSRNAKTAAARRIVKKSLRKPYQKTQTNHTNTSEPTPKSTESDEQPPPQQSYQTELQKLEHDARIQAIQAEIIATQANERAIRAKEMASQAKEKSHVAKYWVYKAKEKTQQTKDRAQEAKRLYYEYKLAKLKKSS